MQKGKNQNILCQNILHTNKIVKTEYKLIVIYDLM